MRIIPFGDRILVKRRTIGEKIGAAGIIYATDETKERETDLADVVYVPEHSFTDRQLIDNAESIITPLIEKAKAGDNEALKALLEFNHFIRIKSITPGDAVMIGKYVGTTFHDNQGNGNMTLVSTDEIIGLLVKE